MKKTVRKRQLLAFGVASGAAGALPLPWLGSWLAVRLRAVSVKRVAELHDVRITRDAMKILVDDGSLSASRAIVRATLTRVMRRLAIPLAAYDAVDHAVQTICAAHLFDRFLEELRATGAERNSPIMAEEARKIRRGLDAAMRQGLLDIAREIPDALLRFSSDLVGTLRGQTSADSVADFVLTAAKNLPPSFGKILWTRFEDAIRNVEGTS